jgi:microsomal epoxide hydrolase
MTVRNESFRVDIPQAALDDLRGRLARVRFPAQLPDAGWDYGTELEYLRAFVDYWRDTYDWRATEARLNQYEHFTTEIDGATIHFLHVRSPEPEALPIVLTHGWPGSVVEFLDVIGPLSDPSAHGGDAGDAFHVIVPSLPGYAFSGPTRERGWHPGRVAKAWSELMAGLGYSRYLAQGGDWGSFVTSQLALADPDHCVGIHVNMLAPIPMTDDHTPEEEDCLASMASYNDEDSGYYKEQSTKPQTIGYALDDSPVGLAAWIVEKFRTWSDCDGDVERSFTKDQLIDNLMLYWLNATAHSAGRMYFEFDKGLKAGTLDLFSKVTQPVGYARYPKEIMRTSRRWAEAQYPISHFADMARGGHFAAFEVPDLFVPDVREWARSLR